MFQMENSPNCVNDFVAVYDGDSFEDTVLQKFCGEKKPKMVAESSGNKMTVRMKTNEAITDYGFLSLFIRIAPSVQPKAPEKGICLFL